ncbi:sulfotransferase [Cereibacter sphaeroides]|uniref:sulfotransferase family protein n=1 Tax=Cereibacter sphaeroides TaxID=1063 RepID=UPI003FCDBA7B
MSLVQASPPRIALIVLGMHRSGTSALAGVLAQMGCDLPLDLMPSTAFNPRGHFESLQIYHLNDAILASGGSAWDDWAPFNPEWYRSPRLGEFRQRAAEVMAQEFGRSSLIVLKDPRICRLLPFWKEVLAEAGFRPLFVCTHRAPDEVAASLSRREGWPPGWGQLLWLRHVLEAEAETRQEPRLFVSYEALLSDWRATVARIGEGLGLRFPRTADAAAPAIRDFLADELRHFRSASAREGVLPPDWIRRPQEIFGRWAATGETAEDWAELDGIRAEVDRATPMLGMVARDAARASAQGRDGEEAEKAEQAMREEELALLRRAQADTEARLRHATVHLEAMTRQLSAEIEATAPAELQARERLPAVEAARAALEREVDDLRQNLRHRAAHVVELERHAGALAERAAALEQCVAALEQRVAELEQCVAELEGQGEALERQRKDATGKLAAARLQIAEMEARHAAILSSTSWKVTRPIRSAVERLHRAKQPS